jgi:hypothetical protein
MKHTEFKRKPPKYAAKYSKVIRKKGEAREVKTCQGCGENKPCTNSHLIPRSRRQEFICDELNIHDHCQECADKCETGKYELLQDGLQIVGYIHSIDPDYLAVKNLKFEPRMGVTIWHYFNLESKKL